jgi:TPP-dependent 2-oxoacid decarboxylase
MKKKKIKSKPRKKPKQKIDVVLESLLNLEKVVKELVKKIDESNNSQPVKVIDTNSYPEKRYWPNTEPPFKYKDIVWSNLDENLQRKNNKSN